MSLLGKIHEISFYGLIATILSLITDKISLSQLYEAAFNPIEFIMIFKAYLFWSSVLFIPLAIISAFSTKYTDKGDGLTFNSNHILVIIFAHIAEECLGLFLSPFWFLKDFFTKNFNFWKVIDYATYFIELIFIGLGFFNL